ncbi:hypothetical protein [Promicromonospora sp. NPDC090134]|uniref:hypothetical protein n=1 Tax=Promicromonospora sp. NPDC090134 TaxID=3364408 RepID=UPI003818B89E
MAIVCPVRPAVVGYRLDEPVRLTASALALRDPYDRFRASVLCLFEGLAGDRVLSEALTPVDRREAASACLGCAEAACARMPVAAPGRNAGPGGVEQTRPLSPARCTP